MKDKKLNITFLKNIAFRFKRALLVLTALASFASFENIFAAENKDDECTITDELIAEVLKQIETQKDILQNLPYCYQSNRKLILKAVIVDPQQLSFASNFLKDDASFVTKVAKVNPASLQFISTRLKSDANFMEHTSYIYRDALKYADPKLLDDKPFVKKMIEADSRNYIFASKRLQEMEEFAADAFEDNGLLLEYAPMSIRSNPKIVEIAVKSNSSSFVYASGEAAHSLEIKRLAGSSSIKSKEDLENFLRKSYLVKNRKENLGESIGNKAKFFHSSKIIDRNYVTKWKRADRLSTDFRLTVQDNRNYQISWKKDFHKYPKLAEKIEKFLAEHQVSQNKIDNLATTYLWKLKNNPASVAFNLYFLGEGNDSELGARFASVTSLTAIATLHDGKWHLSIVQVIFDTEMKMSLAYENGHRKYILWDLYLIDKNDLAPKIIFKVEDKFDEYFEVFEKQAGGKYQMIYRIDI